MLCLARRCVLGTLCLACYASPAPASPSQSRLHRRRNRSWLGATAALLLLAAAAYKLGGSTEGIRGVHRAPAAALASLKMTSYYERWIRSDLKRWQHTGITTVGSLPSDI